MDEGWTQWLPGQYEFPHSSVRPCDIRSGTLRDRFDAILIPNVSKDAVLKGVDNKWTRPEHRGGIGGEGIAGPEGVRARRRNLDPAENVVLAPIEKFPLPLRNPLKGLLAEQFSCPGSILKVFVDPSSPVASGIREEASAVFFNDVAFEPVAALGDATVRAMARYPSGDILQSG